MTSMVVASHNLLFSLKPGQWIDDLMKTNQSDVCGYQEVGGDSARDTLLKWCSQSNRGVYAPDETDTPISWRSSVFSRVDEGFRMVHGTAQSMGVRGIAGPAKGFTWVGLCHLASGKQGIFISVHPIARATDPTPEEPPDAAKWSDWAIGQYWLDIVAFTAKQLSRPKENEPRSSMWDFICLMGDYNGDLFKEASDEWYYPSQILPSLYGQDRKQGGLDHFMFTHHSDVRWLDRWTKDGNTDHPLQFAKMQFVSRPDFPA